MSNEQQRYSVSVGFDGVIHTYTSGWQGADVIPDPPVPGAIDWLNAVAAEYDIVILTTRAREPEGIPAVEAYLREHGFTGGCVVTAEKLPALIYVDDRGWRFRGRFPSLRQIRHMKPWKVTDPENPTAVDRLRVRGQELKRLQDRQHRLKWELRQATERLDGFAARSAVLLATPDAEGLESLLKDLGA